MFSRLNIDHATIIIACAIVVAGVVVVIVGGGGFVIVGGDGGGDTRYPLKLLKRRFSSGASAHEQFYAVAASVAKAGRPLLTMKVATAVATRAKSAATIKPYGLEVLRWSTLSRSCACGRVARRA